MRNLMQLPPDLPIPIDDGACRHLVGAAVPALKLPSSKGRSVDLRTETKNPTVIFFYPRTGEPDKPAPSDWDLIPGARGCTPQSCGFRDLFQEFQGLGFQILGASTQTTAYQQAFCKRNHIPFEILSDHEFQLVNALNLPTFDYNGMQLIKRLALVVDKSKIVHVFYPVFPPDKNAETVLSWLKNEYVNLSRR